MDALSASSMPAAAPRSGAGRMGTGAAGTAAASASVRLGRRDGAALTSDSAVAAVEMNAPIRDPVWMKCL